MEDNNALSSVPAEDAPADRPGPLQVTFPLAGGGKSTAVFDRTFYVGRHPDCQIRVIDNRISRQHLKIFPRGGNWWVRDLATTNGTFVGGERIDQLAVPGALTLQLGSKGPFIELSTTIATAATEVAVEAGVRPGPAMIARPPASERAGSRWIGVGLVSLLLLAIGAGVVYYQERVQQARHAKASELALEMFYGMKTLELQIADLEDKLDKASRREYLDDLIERNRQLESMREKYRDFVDSLGLVPRPQTQPEELILRIARLFGESEVNMPEDFIAEVYRYINRWQGSDRFAKAVRRLHRSGHLPLIHQELTTNGLPAQFIYLALQESDFDARAVGPKTRWGFAKGMWQMIPETGARYGLKPGPLKDAGVYDPADERHHVAKATRAAAKYLKYIYRTDAQASGLLVMAAYNWGEGNIIKQVRQLPNTPKDRNFWRLLELHEIPEETYDYVFYIFSAAVIGEDPELFGFDFRNPLYGFPAPEKSIR